MLYFIVRFSLILEWKQRVHILAGVWRAMGIKGLAQLIGDFAAGAIKDQDIKAFFGRYIYTYVYRPTAMKT